MRKLTLAIGAMLMFTVAAWAQGGSGSGSSGGQGSGAGQGTASQSSGSQSGSTAAGQSSSQTAGQSSDQSGSYNNQTGEMKSAKVKGEKTVEGCIVSSGTEFFLQPKHGKMIRLNDQGANLQAHVNHRVKVHGAEEKAGMAGSGTAASASGTSAPESGQSNPAAGTGSSTASNQPGAVGGSAENRQNQGNEPGSVNTAQAGQAGNLPQSGESNVNIDRSNVSNKEITVTRVDMVSETCPADWMNKAKGEKNKPSSSDMNNPH